MFRLITTLVLSASLLSGCALTDQISETSSFLLKKAQNLISGTPAQAPDGTPAAPPIEPDPEVVILPTRDIMLRTPTESLELTVEIADSEEERQRGLMYRTQMPADAGMLFVFPDEAPRNFWMKNTRIPLDIIYFDGKQKVVSVIPGMRPCTADPCGTYASVDPAMFALEFPAGFLRRHPVRRGDEFVVEG